MTIVLAPPTPLGSVLDVGCGPHPTALGQARRYVGIDIAEGPDGYIQSDWRPALATMQDQEFDTVLALDFIEHLTEPDAHDFLTEAKRVGHNVFIFTPLGPFEQDYGPDHPQTHRSAWTPEDFPDWRTYVLKDFHGRGRSAFWACWGEGRAT